MKNKLRWGRLRKVYNIVSHYEKVQNLLIAICCFGIIILIILYCLIFG